MITKDDVLRAIRPIQDPEIKISVVDLGLIYDVELREGGVVHVRMTLTSPGCPYGPELIAEAKSLLMMLQGVKDAEFEVVWTPPWSTDRMSESAKLELGLDV